MMQGYKTWAAALIVAASSAAEYLGYSGATESMLTIGAALGLIGLGHKIEKSK